MIQEYKKRWINNTDIPQFTWKGRTTYDTRISPLVVQIYNVVGTVWETLMVVNTLPADTDIQITDTQPTNISNYYDSNNIVAFRIYQKVN